MIIKNFYKTYKKWENQEVTINGWVRSNRDASKLGFLVINDGTYFQNIQVVYKEENIDNFKDIKLLRSGSAVQIIGKVIITPDAKQPFEIIATKIKIYNKVNEDYPLQKKHHSLEYLREIAYLRPRTNLFWAIFSLRSSISYAIHSFFHENDFVYLHSPIITSNDAEGAGEAFIVTNRDDNKYDEDFFGKKANLTVSGQLNAEAYAQAFSRVYTFGPTFRAENSNTTRHVAEFWMIEPEVAFSTLEENIILATNLIKYIIKYVLENNNSELEFCNEYVDNTVLRRLQELLTTDFVVMTYTEVIDNLTLAIKNNHQFENANIKWGMDLQTEHERYVCEVLTKKPTFVINYPKEIKAFYMKTNSDQKTVQAMDLLVPNIGELIGGSQREEDYDKLLAQIKATNLDIKEFNWYLNFRKYGYAPSGGFGLGLERLIMLITGINNIRDVLPFPRTPKNLEF